MLEIYKNSAHFIGAANFQVTPWVAQLHLLLLLLFALVGCLSCFGLLQSDRLLGPLSDSHIYRCI